MYDETKKALILLTVGWLALASTATGEDVARRMPADTLSYVGWEHPATKDDPHWRFLNTSIEALQAFLRAADDADAEALSPILEFVRVLPRTSGGIGILDAGYTARGPTIELLGVINGLPDPRRWEALFVPGAPATQFGQLQLRQRTLPEGSELFLGVHEDRLVFAIGEQAAQALARGFTDQGARLVDDAEFAFARGRVAKMGGSRKFCAYVSGKQLARLVNQAVDADSDVAVDSDTLSDALGYGAVRSLYWQHGGGPRGSTGGMFVHLEQGASQGLLRLMRQRPLDRELLKCVPRDATWAQAGTLDYAGLWEELLRVVGQVAPDSQAGLMTAGPMTKQFLGFSIPDEFLPALGDQWLLFDAPQHGGIILTGMVVVLEPRDAQALDGMITRLGETLAGLAVHAEMRLQQKAIRHGEHTIHYWLGGGLPIPVAPAWVRVGDRMAFGLTPQTLAAALPRLAEPERAGSLLDRPDVLAALERDRERVVGLRFVNAKVGERLLYPLSLLAHTAAVSFSGAEGVDFGALPPFPEVLAASRDLVSVSRNVPDGYTMEYSGSGLATNLAVLGGEGLLVPAASGVAILLPALARARETARRTVSAVNLRSIGMAAHIYANEHNDRLPKDLQTLVDRQMITPETLRSPRDPSGNAVSYRWVVRGRPGGSRLPDLDPANDILAYETPISHAGTNVLFVDGHVQWVEPDEWERLAKRLPKDDPEWRE